MRTRLAVNLKSISYIVNASLPFFLCFFGALGYFVSFYFHFLTVTFLYLCLVNFIYCFVQKDHSLLANFGLIAQMRYMTESIGPELRQYLFSSDTEEKPFSRIERNEVYMKAKGLDSSSAFGSQLLFDDQEMKLRHSLYPKERKALKFSLVFGEERGMEKPYELKKPFIIGGMSYGALGERAVRALARGAARTHVLMNTGEGGFPKPHLKEGCDLIFQIGTAKFGVRDEKGHLDENKLKSLSEIPAIKMIEIKFSQGAKPGKGGILPKEKITKEIAKLRGVSQDSDILSPPYHEECKNKKGVVQFIHKIQDISQLPVGIKLCFGREEEFRGLILEMKKQGVFPDFINIDGAEGGTGAAPKSFMDDIGIPLFKALPRVHLILKEENVRDRLKLLCAGKLISAGKQFFALSMGADAVLIARGFMLALGCIQALQCNKNICPVGITTHDPRFQKGLDIEQKSKRVENYIKSLIKDYEALLSSMGRDSFCDLNSENIYLENLY